MVITESWFEQDLQKPVIQRYISGNFFSLDNVGNLVGVKVYDNGAEATLSGSVTGYCVLADGTTVPVTGTRSGNQAYILLPQSVLSIPGYIGIALKLTDGNTITTLLSIIATVYPSQTDAVITPSSQVITDWSQQINTALQNVVDASATQDAKISDLKSAFADTITGIADVNLFPFATIKTGYYINASGVETSGTGFACTELIEVEPGDYVFSAVAASRSTSWTLRLHAYSDGVWQRQIDTIAVTRDGGTITKAFTLNDGENGVRVSYVDVLSDGVLISANGPTAIDKVLRNDMVRYERNIGVTSLPASCDDVVTNSVYFVSTSGGQTTVPDFPLEGASGWLKTIIVGAGTGSKAAFQIAYPYSPDNHSIMVRRKSVTQVWGDWLAIGSNSGNVTYNITQNINRDEINNTYTINTTPQITTDTHGWLEALDTESTAQANATDMTGAIMSILNSTGYCHLGEGCFWVSGNIAMPAGSTLEGCGGKTIVRLLDSVSSGYIVQPTERCTIRNITFAGGSAAPSDLQTVGTNLGSRHGVYIVANADGNTSHGTVSGANNILDGCLFRYFDGSAIYMANTGGSVLGVLSATDINIRESKVGINIDYYSEYNKFANVIIYRCNHGCINNGGNNTFVGCTFGGVVGFLIDNSGGDKRNNAHGTCSGCTYNHIDGVNRASTSGGGDGIVVKGATNGFLFTGCQLWYGEIVVENSRGISFSNCLIGGGTPSVTVLGSYPAFFSGCIFHQTPTLNVISGTKFDNCYLDSNGSAISA